MKSIVFITERRRARLQRMSAGIRNPIVPDGTHTSGVLSMPEACVPIANLKSFIQTIRWALITLAGVIALASSINAQGPAQIRVSVLDFGEPPTGIKAAAGIREALRADKLAVQSGVTVIDRNLAIAAARGNGYQ